jgi:hypothetical protein
VQSGNDDVRGLIVAKLDDEFGEIRFIGSNTGSCECVVELNLFRSHRLDLDDFSGAGVLVCF